MNGIFKLPFILSSNIGHSPTVSTVYENAQRASTDFLLRLDTLKCLCNKRYIILINAYNVFITHDGKIY